MNRVSTLGAAVALVTPALALARAGGGQHYSAGGSSFSGGGGGGGGLLGDVLWLILRAMFDLTIDYPLPMMFVWGLIFLGVVAYMHNSPGQAAMRAYQDLSPPVRADSSASAVSQIPGLDLEAFHARVRRAFLTVQEAWFRRDLPSARVVMSDGVLGRFMAQQELMALEGVRNAVAQMEVLGTTLIGCAATPYFHLIDVAVEARARDIDVPVDMADDPARARAQGAPLERFTEVWTFARRPGVTPRGDATEGRCPNCGADYAGGPSAQCAYCHAILNSGHFDWVLCGITQPQEAHLARRVTDFSALLSRDPEFNPFALEDRAALCFWKVRLALARVDAAGLSRVASADFRDGLAPELSELQASGQRWSFREAAVGSAELLGIDAAVEGGFDRAHVKIRWSVRASRVAVGRASSALEPVAVRSTVLTLSRSAEAKTSSNQGLATDRCGHCGAVVESDAQAVCSYCNTELGTGAGEWVLVEEQPFVTWNGAAREWGAPATPRVSSPHERERILVALASLMRGHGLVRPADRRLLCEFAGRWHVPVTAVQAAIDQTGSLHVDLPPRGGAAAEAFFDGVVALARADGRIDAREQELLGLAARELQVSPDRAIRDSQTSSTAR